MASTFGVSVEIDTSEVEPGLRKIADAFELGQLQKDDDAALMVRAFNEGTYLYASSEPYQFRLRWQPWAAEAIRRVLV